MNWYITVLIIFSLKSTCYSENESFVPTKEWQEIKPGQKIPAGLHIRMNLETSKKEAKLLQDDKENQKPLPSSSLSVVLPAENSNEKYSLPNKKKEKFSKFLSEALNKIPKKSEAIDLISMTENTKKEYKSYDEPRHSLKYLNQNFKSDVDIISELIKEYQNVTKEESKQPDVLRILENFNYLVHQIDNAIWFIEENGLELVLLPNIVNNTNTALKVQSMRILGTLTQNNPNAQISVYEKNFGSYLSQILTTSVSTEEMSTALYAFGSLLRKFPHAQKNILSRSGIRALIAILSKNCEIKIKVKAFIIISDLIVEKNLAIENEATQDSSQYFELNFEELLNNNEFCQTVDEVFTQKRLTYDLIEQPNITEDLIQALEITEPICQQIWSKSAQLRHTLLTVKNRYIHTNEEYRLEVAKSIEKLTLSLFRSTVNIKDEL